MSIDTADTMVRRPPPQASAAAGEEQRGAGRRWSAVIIGTGIAGIGMAAGLKRQGVEDFVVLEKADTVGGVWRDNTYPGAACDVPSHLYPFPSPPIPTGRGPLPPRPKSTPISNAAPTIWTCAAMSGSGRRCWARPSMRLRHAGPYGPRMAASSLPT